MFAPRRTAHRAVGSSRRRSRATQAVLGIVGLASLLLLLASTILASASCSGSECDFDSGCTRDCETQEDCEDVVSADAPIVCQQVGTSLDVNGKSCTRTCTGLSDCGYGICVCTAAPNEGWCSAAGRPREALCRADMPPIHTACRQLTRDLSTECSCSITGADLDACDHYAEMYPTCEQQLDDFFFCGLRSTTEAFCAGVGAEGVCAAELAALEACTGTTWNRYRAELCF